MLTTVTLVTIFFEEKFNIFFNILNLELFFSHCDQSRMILCHLKLYIFKDFKLIQLNQYTRICHLPL